jgi:hypothetical protein
MGAAVYNLAILNMAKPALRLASGLPIVTYRLLLIVALGGLATGSDWNTPEQQLAKKVVAVTGTGTVTLTVENRSSLGKRDSEIIQNGLRSAIEGFGIRVVKAEQAAATVTISLSENPVSYVWVAEIRQSSGETAVVIVSTARAEGSTASHDSAPLSLRKIPLWTQDEPILDVAVMEENATPTHIAVLDSEKLSLYRLQGGKWEQEQTLEIVHARGWPRDLRGRLIPAKDHWLDAYLPGVLCHSTAGSPLTLNCHESDDPWPLTPGTLNGGTLSVFPSAGLGSGASTVVPLVRGFFASTRNFFTGAVTPAVGRFATVPKFYSAALLPREKSALWLFAATDGEVHLVDGVSDQATKPGWGSDLASVKTSCGAGWQVLATSLGSDAGDSIRAYEFPDREPLAVSAAVEFSGEITALWTEAKGDSAIAIERDRETGSYEAFRLALSCGQ